MSHIALFPGSFDPFTNGHHDIVLRTLPLVDKLVIAIGINESKRPLLTPQQRLDYLVALYKDEPRIEVTTYSGLTTDLATELGARYIIRGLRNTIDFEYERNIAQINRELTGIETLYIQCSPQYAAISSSAIRELLAFGKPIDHYLPAPLTTTK